MLTAPVDLATELPGGPPASRGTRLVGWAIDSLAFVFVGVLWTGAVHGARAEHEALHGLFTKNFSTALIHGQTHGRLLLWEFGLVVILAGYVYYKVGWQSRHGSTVGRWLTGTRLVTMDGEALALGQLWKRLLVVQGLGVIPLPATGAVSCLWALRDPLARTLADRGAGTRVVRTDSAWTGR